MFQRIGAPAYKKDLTNITALCEALGHPQRNYPLIHVAGTNGKGSVSFMLSAILQAAGLKTGLCVSPHYRDFRERARINGQYVSKAFVVDFVRRVRPVIDAVQPSFFELSTALAFDYFSSEKVDVAVIETGLGGRLDSTNIVEPVLSVITNIGFDHTEFLGNTLPLIAAEKAGIIKAGIPVVIGESHPETAPVFRQTAEHQGSELVFADERYRAARCSGDVLHTVFDIFQEQKLLYLALEVQLSVDFQTKNIQTVLQSVEILDPQFSITGTHVRSG
ncbi:MAG TPA: Mur ligase family protein, partial [Saprospiraceae bacterium]|nr:Mur ligase family protein [Saprospiraceae bacterium]